MTQTARTTVVVNDYGQHALLASFTEVPTVWTFALEESSRTEDLSVHWTDMRGRSPVLEMEIAGNGAGATPL
jgi:uncharacterized protein YbdZ (MbtH family)